MDCCNHDCTQGRNCPVRIKAGGPPPKDITPPPEFWERDETEDFASSFLLIGAVTLIAMFLMALVGFGAGLIWGWVR